MRALPSRPEHAQEQNEECKDARRSSHVPRLLLAARARGLAQVCHGHAREEHIYVHHEIIADTPAPLLRAVVQRRGPEPKGAYERAHVSKVLLLRLVSAVCLELRVER